MMAPMANDVETTGQDAETVPLNLHKDSMSAQSLDLKDDHGMQTAPSRDISQ